VDSALEPDAPSSASAGRPACVQRFQKAEILSHLGTRAEGMRVKHAIDRNSVKMYDKQQSVLQVETTINNTRQMKVFRASENDPDGPPSWQKLRKGVADLHRRELSALYPRLVQYAMTTFGSSEVLRFLGKRPGRDQAVDLTQVTQLGPRTTME
jgi:hypothetical protein